MVGNLKNSFIEKHSTSGGSNSFSNNKQSLTKLPSISSLLNDDENEQNNNNNNTVENGDKMFTKSLTASTTPISATSNTSLSMAKNNVSNDQTYPHSSSVPLPRMVSVSKMNLSHQQQQQQNVSPYLATTMNTNNSSSNTIGNDIAMKKDLSQQQQQSRVHFIQQSQLSPQFVQQQPIPQYRVINNNKYQLNMDISRNNSSNSNNGSNNNSISSNNNMPLAVPVPMHSSKNLSIPIINSNNSTTTNSDAYSTPFSPYSQSRTYSGQTRTTSGNQITPLSATTTIYRQNSRAGFTPMNTVFSKNQDMSAHVTPINRIQFASSAKHHSESFSSSSPQVQGNTPKSANSRKHFRSLPVLYQQQRANSHVINTTPDINSNNNSMNPSNGNIQQQQQQTIINGNNDPSYHNNMMFTQQYNQYPQHLHHEQQQQQLPSQTLYQYPQQYIQIPVQQDHHVSSPMFVQQAGNISGRTPSRLSFSNYNGFTLNTQQQQQQQQTLISKTPPMVDTREKQTSLNSDLSPKRTTSNSSNLSDSHFYKNEMIEVEVETEIPVKRIPRPRNAFILFRQHYHRLIFQEQTEKLASERSNSDPTNENSSNDNGENIVNSFKLNSSVSKTIGLKWKNLSPEERKHWSDLAEKEKADHQMKYPDYKYVPRRKKIIKK